MSNIKILKVIEGKLNLLDIWVLFSDPFGGRDVETR